MDNQTLVVSDPTLIFLKIWKAWVVHQSNAASDLHRLRRAVKRWRIWQKWWKTRLENFHRLQARRALASAVSRWCLKVVARRSRRLEATHARDSRLLRKCLLALADNAHSASVLRRLLESCRRRALRECLEKWWRRRLFSELREDEEIPNAKEAAVANASTRRHRCRRPGKPRKAHCRCVYAVGLGGRCACAPRSHLLRRVEELHRLVAKGLGGHEGGYRLLSHVVQRADAPPDGAACSMEKSNPQDAFERRRKSGSRDCQQGAASPCAQLVDGGSARGPRLAESAKRGGSDKNLPAGGDCKRDMSSVIEISEGCHAITAEVSGPAARRVVDGRKGALAGAEGPRY